MFGTTDNYNSETFERLHIDFAKEGWRASNRHDEFPQIINWLSRQEKTRKQGPLKQTWLQIYECFQNQYHYSLESLKEFLNSFLQPQMSSRNIQIHSLPFTKLDIFYQFKFHPVSLQDDIQEDDIIKAIPKSKNMPSGQFDTIIALRKDTAELTGIEGTQAGRVRVIFHLPETLDFGMGPINKPETWPTEPLVYVEWYSQFKSPKETKKHDMYMVKKSSLDKDSIPHGSIIPLSNIRQGCMLIPKFNLQGHGE
ncbi:hypothetical protein BDZ94DRAFT_1333498 [Collybia nuda]|uniref:Uncharacterized protein n=1 Tax=Collybia nuda TaxID=64659 RepID=A0A9P5XXD4_9AGAR|nr:hypothetical protein BDZ94DRAFT_1333498 [Collybia nuda]